jgi:hypothetical protein
VNRVLGFLTEPLKFVRGFLDWPSVVLETWETIESFWKILSKRRLEVCHLFFTGQGESLFLAGPLVRGST